MQETIRHLVLHTNKYSDYFIRLQLLFCFKQLLWHVLAVYIRLRQRRH